MPKYDNNIEIINNKICFSTQTAHKLLEYFPNLHEINPPILLRKDKLILDYFLMLQSSKSTNFPACLLRICKSSA